jgi:hypothetical protein
MAGTARLRPDRLIAGGSKPAKLLRQTHRDIRKKVLFTICLRTLRRESWRFFLYKLERVPRGSRRVAVIALQ